MEVVKFLHTGIWFLFLFEEAVAAVPFLHVPNVHVPLDKLSPEPRIGKMICFYVN